MAPVSKPKPRNTEEQKEEQIKDAKIRYKDAEKRNKWRYWVAPAIGTLALTFHNILPTFLGGRESPSFQATSVSLKQCLNTVCAGKIKDCVGYPNENGFYTEWARPFNQALNVIPAAVIRPKTPEDISAIVKCAAKNNVKVQARSGGHSYANYGLGGDSGAISIDLQEFKYVIVNATSGQAKIGSGSRLLEIDKLLHEDGKRTFPHGICPGVGIGGHATVGGLGPMSRMWGTCIDHIEEIEVVTSDGSIVRASQNENDELFFALRGAGAGFGIATEFVMRTHVKLNRVVHFTKSFSRKNIDEIVGQFEAWQNLIAHPELDSRFGTEFWLNEKGAEIRSTFYGSKDEFINSNILELISKSQYQFINKDWAKSKLTETSWDETYKWQTDNMLMWQSDLPSEFYSRSLGFTTEDLLSRAAIKEIFQSIHKDADESKATKWFVIFDATGGQVSKVPMDATAYAHRDKVMFYQSYALNLIKMSEKVPKFLNKTHEAILSHLPNSFQYTTYPGYIDPNLDNAQQVYWGSNLPRLEHIKAKWDPNDIFHNPQSVRKD